MKLPACFSSLSPPQLISFFAISHDYTVSLTASCEGSHQRWHENLTALSNSALALPPLFTHPLSLVRFVQVIACLYCEAQMGKCSVCNYHLN